MHQQRKWEEYLPMVEFVCNNGYHESLRMSLFEALYGWCCNTLINWSDPVNRVLIGPNMLVEMEQEMQVIKKNKGSTKKGRKVMKISIGCLRSFRLGNMCIFTSRPKRAP